MAAAKSYKRDGQGARNVHLLRRAPSLVQHIGALGDSGLRPSAEYPAQPILSNCIQLQQTRLTQIDLRAKLQGPRQTKLSGADDQSGAEPIRAVNQPGLDKLPQLLDRSATD